MYWFQLRQRITGKVIETGFYMGTMAQAIDREGGFDLFSERGLGSIREDVFVDVCGNQGIGAPAGHDLNFVLAGPKQALVTTRPGREQV